MQAATAAQRRFTGFPCPALALLHELAMHNDRAGFAPRGEAFNAMLVGPAIDLVAELGPLLRRRVSSGIRAEPRVGGSILRLRHDARFGPRAPFRTHLELRFWEGPGPSHRHPGCFLRLTPDRLVLGAGISTFPADTLPRYRRAVDEPESGRELVAALRKLERKGWSVEGASIQRVPRPYPADHERAALLRRLGMRVERAEPLPDAVFSHDLVPRLAADISPLRPIHHWLRRLQ
jgi:uncharacterized protein (TIGR02453 family)